MLKGFLFMHRYFLQEHFLHHFTIAAIKTEGGSYIVQIKISPFKMMNFPAA